MKKYVVIFGICLIGFLIGLSSSALAEESTTTYVMVDESLKMILLYGFSILIFLNVIRVICRR